MAFSRPALQAIIDRISADFSVWLPGADATIRRSVLNVLGKTVAGAAHGLYGYLAYIARQVTYDTVDAEILERMAAVWGITRKAAASATGNVTFTGTNGTNVPQGTVLARADGAQFTTTVAGAIAAGTLTVAVTAATPGAAGNTAAGALLALANPIGGVGSSATVAAGGITAGADKESDDALRARWIARVRQPPHAGADFDFVAWALEVAGVTRAWAFPAELGLGSVTVRFVRDNDAGSIIPDAAEVAAVQAYIDARRPVTAQCTVVAPVAVAQNFTFTALAPNTQSVKDAITAQLKDLLLREAKPGGTIFLSHVREAVSLASGEDNFTMTVPAADIVSAVGQMPILGVVTFP